MYGVRRVEEAALGPYGTDGPEVREWVRRRAGTALAGHTEAPLDCQHRARPRLVRGDRGGGRGTSPPPHGKGGSLGDPRGRLATHSASKAATWSAPSNCTPSLPRSPRSS